MYESAHVRVTAEPGVATLWLGFPGEPVNALDRARLRDLDAALAAVDRHPAVRVLVVRSAKPAGFCAGVHPAALASLATAADAAAFAWAGQQVFARLTALAATTVALIDGPCLGAGLELALACDHRLCVARPTTHLGFPDAAHGIRPCFGGTAHFGRLLASGATLSGREAKALGLVDHAFCERRAKIELRTFLDRLERTPWRAAGRQPPGGPAERRAFAQAMRTPAARRRVAEQLAALRPPADTLNPIPPFPAVVGLLGDDPAAARLAADVVLRGGRVVVCGTGVGVFAGIATALRRGFVTPLEADQARARVAVSRSPAGFDRAGLVFAPADEPPDELADVIRPRCVVATPPGFAPALPDDPDTAVVLAAWLKPFGVTPAAAVRAAELVAA